MVIRSELNRMFVGSRSRIGWGAVFSGLLVAFVLTLILNAFGVAIAVTGDGEVGTGMAIWSIIVALVSLFAGGWVMARQENAPVDRMDLAVHGAVLWGVLTFGLLYLAVNGIRIGLDSFITAASSVADQMNISSALSNMEGLGLTEAQMSQLRDRFAAATPPAASAAWWSFVGLIVSLGATIAGALSGGRVDSQRPTTLEQDDFHTNVPRAS